MTDTFPVMNRSPLKRFVAGKNKTEKEEKENEKMDIKNERKSKQCIRSGMAKELQKGGAAALLVLCNVSF